MTEGIQNLQRTRKSWNLILLKTLFGPKIRPFIKPFGQMTKVPIAVGEQFGDRWDINELIEQ